MLDRFGARSQSSVEKVTVKNVMNPLLWVCGLVSLPCLGVIAYAEKVSWVVNCLALAPVGTLLVSYVYFALRTPDRLQSESYQLRKQALELIEEKGSLAVIDARRIEVISNPDMPSLLPHRAIERNDGESE